MTATDTHTEGSDAEISGAEIRLDHVTKRYPGQQAAAVDGLSLIIPAGEIVMFVGPSGCGKTTSLKMINRLIEPTSGSIHIGDNDISGQSADELRRHIGYVIQGGSLLAGVPLGDVLQPDLGSTDGGVAVVVGIARALGAVRGGRGHVRP